MQPLDLLKTAELLIKGGARPMEANLRRAHSTVYYALFHCLARTCADALIGGTRNGRSQSAWQQTYRALQHKVAKNACRHGRVAQFPDAIRDFANIFATMQLKRHLADYDPLARLTKSEVRADIELTRQAMADFCQAPMKDRRAFCAFVLFKLHES